MQTSLEKSLGLTSPLLASLEEGAKGVNAHPLEQEKRTTHIGGDEQRIGW